MESEFDFEPKEKELIDKIRSYKDTGESVKTKLETDEKVLARVTDGIYRLPASAIRELISNAYDADAENVYVETDAPRFETMTIRDDGNGMSIETLVNLLGHIGGSAKRSSKGTKLKVTDEDDTTLSSVKKRKLIGKIGIGLFSVAQLTRDFDIVTKQKGTDFYVKARIRLHNYSEEYIREKENEYSGNKSDDMGKRGASFETGAVEIWTEPTKNLNSQGTDIILRNIKKSARDQLRSVDVWGQEAAETEKDEDSLTQENFMDSSRLEYPEFHVGNYFGGDGFEYYESKEREPALPWVDHDDPKDKLKKLYDGILSLTGVTKNPKLNIVLDNYLHMLWTLSLSVPLNYIEKHPFYYTKSDIEDIYVISNSLKGQASELKVEDKDKPIINYLPLRSEYKDINFNVFIDNVQLFRPLKFKNLPKSSSVINKPILFIGSYAPDLSKVDARDSGGHLAFDAYILWTPKVIPRDHNGVLVRVHNASGILFDETFMKHQVAEHTIKSQLTVEIFVHEGLDSALNIDRESFNISHPHYQIMMRWLHQAIRQVVNKYKLMKKDELKKKGEESRRSYNKDLQAIISISAEKNGRELDDVSELYLIDQDMASIDGDEVPISQLPIESILFSRNRFLELSGVNSYKTKKSHYVESKTSAIVQVLESYGLLDELSSKARDNLIEDIIKIISFEG
ncbi:ATP-binding protein [Shewanella algae]|uniref:ATP-binding protein n=1 Tax=Shewanella algae TaxID=38313 RepID=UPI0030071B6E